MSKIRQQRHAATFGNIVTTNLPSWLTHTISSAENMTTVNNELSAREDVREEYRSISRTIAKGDISSIPERIKSMYAPESYVAKIPLQAGREGAYNVKEAITGQNGGQNRYLAIEPYDSNVVRVNGRYLNASWVKEVYGGAWWVATQAPLPQSIWTFLSLFTTLMPEHQRPRVIVQLTSNVERGVRKGHPYFSPDVGSPFRFDPPTDSDPPIEITLIESCDLEKASCVQSTLEIRLCDDKGTPPIRVQHFFFRTWPDHGVPKDTTPVVNLLHAVNEANMAPSGNGTHFPPIVAHCSAGVGRTGTFIAIASLLRHFKFLPAVPAVEPPAAPPAVESALGPLHDEFSEDMVAREIDGLREQRAWMVQRREQMEMAYKTLAQALSGSLST